MSFSPRGRWGVVWSVGDDEQLGERNLPWGPRRSEALSRGVDQSLADEGPGDGEEEKGEAGEALATTRSAIHRRTWGHRGGDGREEITQNPHGTTLGTAVSTEDTGAR